MTPSAEHASQSSQASRGTPAQTGAPASAPDPTGSTPEDFVHIRRVRDPRFDRDIACLLPGEFFVSSRPMITYTVLGSCVAACIRDPVAGIGGMNHFMLPSPNDGSGEDSWGIDSTRYGAFAMERLVNAIITRGGAKGRLEVKLFGGGRIYEGGIDVGARNADWVLSYVANESLAVTSIDLGGICPRKIYYFTDTGRVLLKKITRVKNQTIHERESAYRRRMRTDRGLTGDITLF